MRTVSVVILSYNRLEKLKENIQILFSRPHTWNEMIIVDNASNDGTIGFLESLQSNIHILKQQKNLGVAAGRNVGFRKAKGNIILYMDDDAILDPNQFEYIVDAFNHEPRLGVFCPLVIHGETKVPQNPHGYHRIEVANYHGAAHAFRKEALEKIGFLDEECFFGGEELDSSIRLYEAGYYCIFFPEVTAQHFSLKHSRRHGFERYLRWTYNYARILYKNFPEPMANCYANRLLIQRIFRCVQIYGLSRISQVWKMDRKGRISGMRQHAPVSTKTIEFYSNENLRPEFGNVPLWRKALVKLAK